MKISLFLTAYCGFIGILSTIQESTQVQVYATEFNIADPILEEAALYRTVQTRMAMILLKLVAEKVSARQEVTNLLPPGLQENHPSMYGRFIRLVFLSLRIRAIVKTLVPEEYKEYLKCLKRGTNMISHEESERLNPTTYTAQEIKDGLKETMDSSPNILPDVTSDVIWKKEGGLAIDTGSITVPTQYAATVLGVIRLQYTLQQEHVQCTKSLKNALDNVFAHIEKGDFDDIVDFLLETRNNILSQFKIDFQMF